MAAASPVPDQAPRSSQNAYHMIAGTIGAINKKYEKHPTEPLNCDRSSVHYFIIPCPAPRCELLEDAPRPSLVVIHTLLLYNTTLLLYNTI
jgi:hypothetical protein